MSAEWSSKAGTEFTAVGDRLTSAAKDYNYVEEQNVFFVQEVQ